MTLDIQTTLHDNCNVRFITAEQNVISSVERSRMIPISANDESKNNYGFIKEATLNHQMLTSHENKLIDILYNTALNKYDLPNDKVISTFCSLSDFITENDLRFKTYTPIEDGGIFIDFFKDKIYYVLELFNDNTSSIYVVDDTTGDPILMDDVHIDKTIEVVKKTV